MKEYQRIYLSMPNSEIEALISEYIHGDFHRDILKDRMISGMTYEQIAEKRNYSVRQIKNIVKEQETILFTVYEKLKNNHHKGIPPKLQ
jgi:ribosome-binding protein aMBF1 (putative translation factor)